MVFATIIGWVRYSRLLAATLNGLEYAHTFLLADGSRTAVVHSMVKLDGEIM
jgi:hypothetical protein